MDVTGDVAGDDEDRFVPGRSVAAAQPVEGGAEASRRGSHEVGEPHDPEPVTVTAVYRFSTASAVNPVNTTDTHAATAFRSRSTSR